MCSKQMNENSFVRANQIGFWVLYAEHIELRVVVMVTTTKITAEHKMAAPLIPRLVLVLVVKVLLFQFLVHLTIPTKTSTTKTATAITTTGL